MTTIYRRGIASAAAALCLMAGNSTSTADQYNRRVLIINGTGYTIRQFFASNENETDWEEDILGQDVLKPGKSVRINIDDGTGACMFDFKAVFSDGDVLIRKGINVCRISTYRYR